MIFVEKEGKIDDFISQKPVSVFKRKDDPPDTILISVLTNTLTGRESNNYVIFDLQKFQFKTLLKAIDFCFKSIAAFIIFHPYESEMIWQVLQKDIYKIRLTIFTNDRRYSRLG